MFSLVPLRGWFLVAIAAAAYTPAHYVLRYVVDTPSRRDITQPPRDYSWRSSRIFARNVFLLAGLACLAVFIFTQAAVQFARSPSFWPILSAALGGWSIFTVVRAFNSGKIQPLVRGIHETYDRDQQPKRFWASLAWNALFGALLVWVAYQSNEDAAAKQAEGQCYASDESKDSQKAVLACTELIEKSDPEDREDRAHLFAARGIAYHRLGDYKKALADYTAAIDLDANDDSSHYNRGLIFQDIGDVWNAETEYSAAISINPKSADAYQRRAEVRGILDRQQASAAGATARLP